ncbi:MAG: hypothetical protein WBG08_01155 [Litorimonas sp.]
MLADYLLGAVDGFSPYFQPYLFERLRPLTRGRLYVTGLEPYVPTVRPEDDAGRIVWEIGRFRDACMLLTGRMPYREYPAGWVVDRLDASGFAVESVDHFPVRNGPKFVDAQIGLCAPGLARLQDRTLADALARRGEALRKDAHQLIETRGHLETGRNYVIAARPV